MDPIGQTKTPAVSVNTVLNHEGRTDLSPIRVDKGFEYINFWS
jgi:hypothetical protein